MKLAMLSDVFNEDIDISDLYKALKSNEMTNEKRANTKEKEAGVTMKITG